MLAALQVVLLTVSARLLSQNLATLLASVGDTVAGAILGDSQDDTAVGQVLASLERRRTAVVRVVTVLQRGTTLRVTLRIWPQYVWISGS